MTVAELHAFVPPRDAILTIEQVAEWMQVSPETVKRMNIPAIAVGRGKRQRWRYVAGMVLDYLQTKVE